MVAASTLKPRDLGFVFVVASYQKKFFKYKIRNFLFCTQRKRDSLENKLASLLVGPWARYLTGCLYFYEADRLRGQEIYPSW